MRRKFALAVLAVLVVLAPFHLQAGQSNDLTVFQIKIVADQLYRNKFADDKQSQVGSPENWKKDLIDLMDYANQELQKQGAKVKFEIVEIAEWQIAEEENIALRLALDDLTEEIPAGDYDLVIGITANDFSREDRVAGYYWKGYILIKDRSTFFLGNEGWRRENKDSQTLLILLHEIGHFLGLEHSDDAQSIMNAAALGFKFLPEEIESINKNAPKIKNKTKSHLN